MTVYEADKMDDLKAVVLSLHACRCAMCQFMFLPEIERDELVCQDCKGSMWKAMSVEYANFVHFQPMDGTPGTVFQMDYVYGGTRTSKSFHAVKKAANQDPRRAKGRRYDSRRMQR